MSPKIVNVNNCESKRPTGHCVAGAENIAGKYYAKEHITCVSAYCWWIDSTDRC